MAQSERRKATLQCYTTSDVRDALHRIAAAEGRTASNMIEKLITDAIDLDSEPHPPGETEPDQPRSLV